MCLEAYSIIWRRVSSSAGTPGLIDLSNGETLANGGALAANHLYAVSVQGRSIYTAQGCTLMIAGSYTVR